MKNTIRKALLAATMTFTLFNGSTVLAENNVEMNLQPLQAHTVTMINYTAVVYYTRHSNGDYQIIANVGPNIDVDGKILQHRATIKPGQSYQLSMDTDSTGNTANVIRFKAEDDTLFVASL